MTSNPGWLPDPTGHYSKRYFDGSAWTDDVLDEAEMPSVDPYLASSSLAIGQQAESGSAQPSSTSDDQPHELTPAQPRLAIATVVSGIVLACGVAVLLSVLSLSWFEAQETGSIAVELSDFRNDGPGLAVVSSARFAQTYDDTGVSKSYADVGYVVSLVVIVLAAAAAFAPMPVRILAAGATAACATWHVLAIDDLTRNVSAAPGAYVGAAGLGIATIVLVAGPPLGQLLTSPRA